MSVHFRIRFGTAPNTTTIPSFEITAAAAGCPLQPLIFSLRLRHMIHSSIQKCKKGRQEGGGVWKSCSAEYLRGASWPMKGCLLGFQQNEDYSVMWYLIEDARRKRRPYYEPYVIEMKAAPSSFKRTYFSGSLDLCLWQKEFGIGHRTLVQCGSIR